jgi:hypothetical protein
MREIKFRAWDGVGMNNWEWFKLQSHAADWLDQNATSDWYVMQYTGLKDKKRTPDYPDGQEIYEGDVVRVGGYPSEAVVTSRVVYYKNGFYLDQGIMVNWNAEDVEVIGNIYENPELLEQSL